MMEIETTMADADPKCSLPTDCPLPSMTRRQILITLFIEYFKISLFIVGGGYAIIIAADDVFGRRLKWLEEGELLAHLPIFQMIPGLIAGNSAIYVGTKVAGTLGAFVAIVAIAIPSIVSIIAIAMGFEWFSMENRFVQGAFIGLRSALCGIVLATIIKSWKKLVNSVYAYVCAPLCCIAIIGWKIPAKYLLISAILFGVITHVVLIPLFRILTKTKKGIA